MNLDQMTAAAKRDLLLKYLRRQAPPTDTYPLSFAQERMWFLDRLQPGSGAYSLTDLIELPGALNVVAVTRSLNYLVDRHAVLRSCFPESNNHSPTQRVIPNQKIPTRLVDLTSIPSSMRHQELQRLRQHEREQPFDLSHGPLFRAMLVRLDIDAHTLILTMHHIVSDGWSLSILRREFLEVYRAVAGGRTPRLPKLPMEYGEFAMQQRKWLHGTELERYLHYWKKQLAGAPSDLPLPLDKTRPSLPSYAGAAQFFTVDDNSFARLRDLAREENATLFMVLLAAFNVLLHQQSGQRDLLVGVPIANRNREELEPLIGLFVNTLVLRTWVGRRMTFRDLVRQVRDNTLAAYANQDLPFEKLVEELRPERRLSHNPLFQVMFFLQNLPTTVEDSPVRNEEMEEQKVVDWESLEPRPCSAKFDLSLGLEETEYGLVGGMEYSTDIFEHDTIRRMLQQFNQLLNRVTEAPDAVVGEIHLLTNEDHDVYRRLNRTARLFRINQPIHVRFENIAARQAFSVAVEHEGVRLSYGDLNQWANQLAQQLIAVGVRPGDRVGVFLHRKPEMIAAVLAVMKAGGAYLPIDPATPAVRIQSVLADAKVQVVVADAGLADHSALQGRTVLPSDVRAHLAVDIPNPNVGVTAKHLAYLIYTSGSTGVPKGVAIEHGAVTNYVDSIVESFKLVPQDRVLQFASLSFDVAVEEIFGTLISGATLVLRTDAVLDSPPAFRHWCVEHGLTVVILPTAFWHELVGTLPKDEFPYTVRLVVIGGQKVYGDRVLQWQTHVPATVKLLNMYGPTETTVSSTMSDLSQQANSSLNQQTSPIGRPLPNVQTYILNELLQPVPVGIVGELYISGAGLARGYINDPSLTAERFVPNPFSREPGTRMYRTGDLVRCTASGELLFVDRADRQVKVRGYRIELGDIESQLRQMPHVADALVIWVPESQRLVAYLLAATDELSVAEVHQWLIQRLPSYMVPSHYILVDEFPMNAAGKVDKQRLPQPDNQVHLSEWLESLTPTETEVAAIWKGVLGRTIVEPDDNFFDIGGHSLLAIQICSRIRDRFQLDLPVRELFEFPTVRQIAHRIDIHCSTEVTSCETMETDYGEAPASAIRTAPPLVRCVENIKQLPLSFAQERLWFIDQLQPGSPAYNLPAVIPYEGPLNVDALSHSIEFIVVRHESLRTVFQAQDNGSPTQVIKLPPRNLLSLVDLRSMPLGQRDSELRRLMDEEAEHPFDLSRGPLLRAQLVRIRDDVHYLLLTMHHIISDGWSVGVLRSELDEAYKAFSCGDIPRWADLPIQYADYAVWQRQWLDGKKLREELEFWQCELAGVPQRLELHFDRRRPSMQSFAGAWQAFRIDGDVCQKIGLFAKQQNTSTFMAYFAAFAALLQRYSGQQDLVIGIPIANRNFAEVEPLIGLFVNALPMRVTVSSQTTFRQLLLDVRERSLRMQEHQDLPFEKLVEEMRPERDFSHQPLFQVMFAFQNTPSHVPVPPAEIAARDNPLIGNCTAKFDITLSLEEDSRGCVGYIEYNTDLFDHETVTRLCRHYEALMGELLEAPDCPVHHVPLVTNSERKQLLVEWKGRHKAISAGTVAQRVEAIAAEHPHQPAIEQQTLSLTYAELDYRANQLAARLQHLGVCEGTLVAVVLEQSIACIVCNFAILKAGGAFLPLDPAYPLARLRFMLDDSQVRLILTDVAGQNKLHELNLPDHECLVVSSLGEPVSDDYWRSLVLTASLPHDFQLAYTIYTSGSTGIPKGVEIHHHGFRNLIDAWVSEFNLKFGDRTSMVASSSFDASIGETWPSLVAGATICIADADTRSDPARLVDWLVESQITVAFMPTPLAVAAFRLPWPTETPLRTLLVAGQQLTQSPPANVPFAVFNLYGPTECSVWSSLALLRHEADAMRPPPIGKPLQNTSLYVLDDNLELVPIGVPGELYISGVGVGRGYRHRPAITAERFVPNPFSDIPGQRMYRTGDVVRWTRTGELEFLGRIDGQVKIRGFRIELGEIDATLNRLSEVESAEVVVRETTALGFHIAAFVVTTPGSLADEASIRTALAKFLPPYMIPARIALLNKLPLLPSGKVDRNMLLQLNIEELGEERGMDGWDGSNPIEMQLAAYWKELLGVANVKESDNFFECGGHSLLMTQLASWVRTTFGVEITLRHMFEAPTFSEIAFAVLEACLQSLDNDEAELLLLASEAVFSHEIEQTL